MTSKKPNIGAIYLNPLDIRIYRIVPIDTSHIRAKKMRIGITINANKSDENNPGSILHPSFNILMSCVL